MALAKPLRQIVVMNRAARITLCQFVLISIIRDTDFVVLAFGRIFEVLHVYCLKLHVNTSRYHLFHELQVGEL